MTAKTIDRLLIATIAIIMLTGAQSAALAVNGPVVYGGGQPMAPQESVWGSQGDGSSARITVTNRSSKDVWITYYNGSYQFEGQAGTQCIPPGMSDFFAHSGWNGLGGFQVRAEKKSTIHCGGKTTDDEKVGANVTSNGSTTVTISDNGASGIGMSFAY